MNRNSGSHIPPTNPKKISRVDFNDRAPVVRLIGYVAALSTAIILAFIYI